jgi:Fe-S cluster assembly protein SufD
MAGLPTKSNAPAAGSSHAMQQFYRLFESVGGEQSSHAHNHWQQVLRLGFPHAKMEDWKYTPVAPLLGNQFFAPEKQQVSADVLKSVALPLDTYRLVFIDGRFSAELSDTDTGDFEIEKLTPACQQTLPEAIQSEGWPQHSPRRRQAG